jgi:hypothetical protein
MTVAVWKPTREEVQVLNEYHYALITYYGAVSNWLKRFDIQTNDGGHQRLTDEKEKSEQACKHLRADLDRLRSDHL